MLTITIMVDNMFSHPSSTPCYIVPFVPVVVPVVPVVPVIVPVVPVVVPVVVVVVPVVFVVIVLLTTGSYSMT